jgi:lysyl-tRNA synthetase class 2
MPALPRVLYPSDVVRYGPRAGRCVTVGGRVVQAEGARLRVADAYRSLDVLGCGARAARPGDLVVVEGRYSRGALRQARLVERYPAPHSTADGEFARLGWSGAGDRLCQRARALRVIRDYFSRRDFVEVDTPLRVRCPGLDANVDAVVALGWFLCTSPELHMKRLLVGGMPRIFQLCHCTRADELGPWHEPEFMMLEWYRAFSGAEAVMRDTELVVGAVVRKLTGKLRLRLPSGRRLDLTLPFDRLSVRDAFRRFAQEPDAVTLADRDPNRYFELLVGQVEPALARRSRPVFLFDYPLSQAALARPAPHDPSVAERFELYVAGVELCNGFGELTDPIEQRRRFQQELAERKRQRRPRYPLDEAFLGALSEGMPPSGGNALGVDRLVALACAAESVADVQAFPAARP